MENSEISKLLIFTVPCLVVLESKQNIPELRLGRSYLGKAAFQ